VPNAMGVLEMEEGEGLLIYHGAPFWSDCSPFGRVELKCGWGCLLLYRVRWAGKKEYTTEKAGQWGLKFIPFLRHFRRLNRFT